MASGGSGSPWRSIRACFGPHRRRPVPLVPRPAEGLAPGLAGHAEGDPVQEAAQRLSFADRRCLAGQHQEGRLKSVLDIMGLPQQAAANADDHRPMPLHQRGKGIFVLAGGVTPQEFPVRHPLGRLPGGQLAEMLKGKAETRACHGRGPLGGYRVGFSLHSASRSGYMSNFLGKILLRRKHDPWYPPRRLPCLATFDRLRFSYPGRERIASTLATRSGML
jgi:hypothetical protein